MTAGREYPVAASFHPRRQRFDSAGHPSVPPQGKLDGHDDPVLGSGSGTLTGEEIPQAVEDVLVADLLDRLDDVSVVTDDQVDVGRGEEAPGDLLLMRGGQRQDRKSAV